MPYTRWDQCRGWTPDKTGKSHSDDDDHDDHDDDDDDHDDHDDDDDDDDDDCSQIVLGIYMDWFQLW